MSQRVWAWCLCVCILKNVLQLQCTCPRFCFVWISVLFQNHGVVPTFKSITISKSYRGNFVFIKVFYRTQFYGFCFYVVWLRGYIVPRFRGCTVWRFYDSSLLIHGCTVLVFMVARFHCLMSHRFMHWTVWFHSLTQFNGSLLHISFKRFLNFTIACHAVARLYGLIHSCTVARSQFHSFFMVTRFDGCTIVLWFHSFTFFVSRCTVCWFHGFNVARSTVWSFCGAIRPFHGWQFCGYTGSLLFPFYGNAVSLLLTVSRLCCSRLHDHRLTFTVWWI